MSLKLGYLTSTFIFAIVFIILLIVKLRQKVINHIYIGLPLLRVQLLVQH
jgi:hypothetical protein